MPDELHNRRRGGIVLRKQELPNVVKALAVSSGGSISLAWKQECTDAGA